VIGPPLAAETAGQVRVTARAGAVVIGQVVVTVLVTATSEQTSLPVARNVVVTEQPLEGTVYAVVKLADAPGASAGTVNTGVLAEGRSLTTMTFVNVILPVLRTRPV
jgi:hypothetical protein